MTRVPSFEVCLPSRVFVRIENARDEREAELRATDVFDYIAADIADRGLATVEAMEAEAEAIGVTEVPPEEDEE